MRYAAYVYPGWHPIPERDASFHPGFTEWELVAACRPRFPGHAQPKVPLWGPYDDRDPEAVGRRVTLALEHGVDALVYGFFWCRGKRVFEAALERGFLGSTQADSAPFGVFWANRMPRRVLPVRRRDLAVVDPARQVPSDIDDFVQLITTLARAYFTRPNYLRVDGRAWFAIYDSTFFVLELGRDGVREAIAAARGWLAREGFPELHLAAIEPNTDILGDLAALGFDSVTHYVFLPDWKGPLEQDYASYALRRAGEWSGFAHASGLPYFASVSPGWDASPRGADFGPERPDRYPWSPVITGEHPALFHEALIRAQRFARAQPVDEPLVFIASLNEWSEGHYIEPDERFGNGWLEAVRAARDVPPGGR